MKKKFNAVIQVNFINFIFLYFNFIFQFNITDAGNWTIDLKTGNGRVVEGVVEGLKPDLIVSVGQDDFIALTENKLNPQQVWTIKYL